MAVPEPKMPESKESLRLIKKYPNRRLYDTKTSSYITLADVKQMVLRQEEFQVVDAKSGDDLTRQILLQIILEEESGGVPLFSSDLLSQLIRSYGNAMQGMMGSYLERNIKAFQDIQKALQETNLKPEQLMMGYRGVKFDQTGQNTEAATYLIQLQGKEYKAVWPAKSATAKLEWPMKGWKQ